MKRRSSTPKAQKLKASRQLLLREEKRLNKDGFSLVAGIDEAGRGPLAGPVVASAVILKTHDFVSTINDSKKLSAGKREKAYHEILEKAHVGIGIVGEKTIDEINIYRATIKAMEMAVADLGIWPDYVIVDGKMKLSSRCPIKCIIKGDSKSMSIAAASIVAKVTRDRLMLEYDKTYPQYGFAKHKGYGTRFHQYALKKHGPSPIHRFSFQPVSNSKIS